MVIIKSLEDGRKEDGNRVIADNIIKRLHELERTIGINQGRWVWELLQNAKDTISDEEDKQISIELILKENSVVFRHNGLYFTEKDIRGIINQVSSKEVEENEKSNKVNKFGTGFLTTHLLSRKIKIEGILKDQEQKYYTFQFTLDREGKTTSTLIPKIDIAWDELNQSLTPLEVEYNEIKKY